MISRRGFLGLLSGFAAAEAARKIYVLPPLCGWKCSGGVISPGEALFYVNPEQWTYRYAYRNIVTGHVSDAAPRIEQLAHTFGYPELDVIDYYHQMPDGSFQLMKTLRGVKG